MKQSCFSRALLLIAFGFQIHAEREGGGLGESPPYTTLQKLQLAFQTRGPVRALLFLPQVSTLRRGIRSFCGCLDTGAQSQMPSRRNRASGTQARVPGAGARPLEEAGISLGMHGEDWRMSCLRALANFRLGAEPRRSLNFYWRRRCRGGLVQRRSARGGRRDEALEEADWEMSAGGGSRERDCAGRAVTAERGCGVGPSGGLAGPQMAAWGEGQGLGHRRGGDAAAKFSCEVTLRQA